ncbi:MAG TPA: cytochrome d ubiquinol oxidase subunit II [Myxococcota bacterium]|nr:cytochrome d ubiquinol oxidase subunit II [Myxococcota bacterium]HRY96686.1 cytochrome d ubiquinol oxidase subunit II [Myxococcota bacterium]HSA20576.1 cytochrome d ubiquinol oxidase subunit II [Myxococcota bacterium]
MDSLAPSALQLTWFLLFGVLVAGYAILDGFDLGVGVLSLTGRDEAERRLFGQAIAPVWDGNEVWLLTAGGSLFAAFPAAYASVFSGFYLAFMLLLLALIARAVALEFRSKVAAPGWRRTWDLAFGLGSLVPSLLFGVAVGNILRGLPLDGAGNYTGTFLGLLHPYALCLGLLALCMFVCHGALYMAGKVEGDLQRRMRAWAERAWAAWVALFLVGTLLTFFFAPERLRILPGNPLVWPVLAGLLASLAGLPGALGRGRLRLAFLLSAAAIGLQIALVGLSLYPHLVPALGDPAGGLTIVQASSSPHTLGVMLVIAGVGMPLVLAYTVFIYRVFKGKLRPGDEAY